MYNCASVQISHKDDLHSADKWWLSISAVTVRSRMWETAQTAGRSGETKEAAKALHILQSVRENKNVKKKKKRDACSDVYVLLRGVLQFGLQSHSKFCELENRCTMKRPTPAAPLRTLEIIVAWQHERGYCPLYHDNRIQRQEGIRRRILGIIVCAKKRP